MMRVLTFILSLALVLSACSFGRGKHDAGDGPPRFPRVDVSRVPDAVPRHERTHPPARKPYTVFGQRYVPMRSARGYRERGVASWYGRKFHGNPTAMGERYDMYTMTAAHKTLPLPTYARVTNLRNGRTVVVRVNDRGPFHRDRVIDLSYAAAHRLGIAQTGTGLVEVTAIDPSAPATVGAPVAEVTHTDSGAGTQARTPQLYVQVGAFSERDNAERLLARLRMEQLGPVIIENGQRGQSPVYRVRIGPLASVDEGDRLILAVRQHGIERPHLIVN